MNKRQKKKNFKKKYGINSPSYVRYNELQFMKDIKTIKKAIVSIFEKIKEPIQTIFKDLIEISKKFPR